MSARSNQKLKQLEGLGVISSHNREVLSAALDVGSAAAHRGRAPRTNDGERDCVTPDTGIWYTLASYPEGKYTNRENVILLLNGQMIGNYWLEGSAE